MGLRVICHSLKQNEAQNACPSQQTLDTLASERRHINAVTTTMISALRRAAVRVELFVIIVTDVVISPDDCFKFKLLKVMFTSIFFFSFYSYFYSFYIVVK